MPGDVGEEKMTLRELGENVQERWLNTIGFFVDTFETVAHGDLLDLTLLQAGFLLFCIWAVWKVYDRFIKP
jgi:hypothetical protein